MASNSSFDIVSETSLEEVQNAVNQSMMEIRQRFDFKNSKSEITLDKGENQMVLVSDDEAKMNSVIDVLEGKLVRRKVSINALEYGKIELASGGSVRQTVKIQQGIPTEKGKEIAKFIKSLGAKVQSQIMDKQVRVSGKKKDDLQTVMASLKEKDFGIDMSFTNLPMTLTETVDRAPRTTPPSRSELSRYPQKATSVRRWAIGLRSSCRWSRWRARLTIA